MKIGTLISTILMIIGTVLEVIVVMPLFNGTATGDELLQAATLPDGLPIVYIFLNVFWITVIFFFITVLTTKKLFMILSAIFGILGVFGIVGGILTGWLSSLIYILSSLSLVLTALFMLFGCIQYRAHNKLAIITSILFFLVIAFHNLYMGFIYPISQTSFDAGSHLQYYLITYLVQSGIFVLHGLILSFSKKDVYADDGAEDIMSVETGGAFASYVPSSGKKKSTPQKSKKSKSKDAYSFDF